MTATNNEQSAFEELNATAEGARELAAAELAFRVADLINQSFDRSRLSNKEFAETLGVTEGRASQILNGDGNIRIATLAKVLTALDCTPDVSATTASGEKLPIRQARRRRDAVSQGWSANVTTTFELVFGDPAAVRCTQVEVEHPHTVEPALLEATNTSTGKRFSLRGMTVEETLSAAAESQSSADA